MLRDQAVSLIKSRLGNRIETDVDNVIITEMILAQEELEQNAFLPWFLLTEESEATTEVDEERMPLPPDFIRMPDEGESYLYIFNAETNSYENLVEVDRREAIDRYPSQNSNKPKLFSLIDEYFYLRPVPDQVYTLKMIYYGKDDTLSTNIENLWLKNAANLLIWETAKNVAGTHLRDVDLAALCAQNAQAAMQQLRSRDSARREGSRDRTMGDTL